MEVRVGATKAMEAIGRGYDISMDLRLKYCKGESSLIDVISSSSDSIKCDKGDRTRFTSDLLSFQQMSEQLNQEIGLTGKIPSGHFNAMFDFSGCWQKDAANTKTLAFDGVFITLYTVALQKSHVLLCDRVKKAVPSSWEPCALASFIETFGTHIVVGLKMGARDVVYLKQQHSSTLQPPHLQNKLKQIADQRFSDSHNPHITSSSSQQTYNNNREHQLRFVDSATSSSYSHKEDIVIICKRRGGSDARNLSHHDWLQTVQSQPDIISMSFIPITSLLNGVPGSGFLSHAINLYLRYKPPIEELHQFLEFQLPRQWAPVFSELPLGPQRKHHSNVSLQFSFLGPKLYVNTIPVEVGKRPVTGMRLYLEGKRSNRLAIHLQHLSSLPKVFQLEDDPNGNFRRDPCDRKYYEKVQWKNFSHVCTAPVESDEDLSIVTGAQLQVEKYGIKNILFLRLRFSRVSGATAVKHPEWDGSPVLGRKSGLISTLISHHFTTTAQRPSPRPADVNINSAIYPGGPPVPVQAPKLLKFVDTTEMTRGPQDNPGYWVVSGARLVVEKGRVLLRVKFSLLTVILPDEDEEEMLEDHDLS